MHPPADDARADGRPLEVDESTTPGNSSEPARRLGPAANVLLWAALILAFSPALHDLGSHWIDRPWSRYSILFAVLLAWSARSGRGGPIRLSGVLLVLLGVVVQAVAAKGAALEVARVALAAGVCGLLILRGLSGLRCSMLAAWIVPVPHWLVAHSGGRELASLLFEGIAYLLSFVGLDLAVSPKMITSAGATMEIDATYGGLPMLAFMMGLAWYRVIRSELNFRLSIRELALFMGWTVPVQLASLLVAAIALALVGVGAAQFVLTTLCWVVPGALVVASTERDLSRSYEPPPPLVRS